MSRGMVFHCCWMTLLVFVSAGMSELQTELKESKEELKRLGTGDPERVPLQQRLAAMEQRLTALQEVKNLLLKADQGGRQV